MAINSYQGVNGVQGVNSFVGGNSAQGSNSYTSSTPNSFMAPASQRTVREDQITDSGLLQQVKSEVGFSPVNSYSKLGVAPLSAIQEIANRRGTTFGGGGGGSALTWADMLFGDAGYDREDLGNGYSYNLLDKDKNVIGVGYYDVETAINNLIKEQGKKGIREKELPNSRTEFVPYDTYANESAWLYPQETRQVLNDWAIPDYQGAINRAMLEAAKTGDYAPVHAALRAQHQPGEVDPNGSTTRYVVGSRDNNFATQEEAEEFATQRAMEAYTQSFAGDDLNRLEAYSQLVNNGLSNLHSGDPNELGLAEYMQSKGMDTSDPSQWMQNTASMMSLGGMLGFMGQQNNYDRGMWDQFVKPRITTAGNQKADLVSGERGLVGSIPVINPKTGKVIGYQNQFYDPRKSEGEAHEGYDDGGDRRSFHAAWGSQQGQAINDADWWKQNAYGLDGNKYFIPVDKASSFAGYTMPDEYDANISDYRKRGDLMSRVGTTLTKGLLNYIAPGSVALMEGATTGNWKNAALNAGVSLVGAGIAPYAGDIGSALGASAEWAPAVGRAAIGAGTGAARGALNGGGQGALIGGLTGVVGSGLNSLAGAYLPDTTLGHLAGGAGVGALTGGLNAALRKGDVGQAMLGGALGGGLNAAGYDLGNYLGAPSGLNMGGFGTGLGQFGTRLASDVIGKQLARKKRKTSNG